MPEWEDFVARGSLFGVVEASYVAEAEEDVGEAVLWCVSGEGGMSVGTVYNCVQLIVDI